MNIVYQWERKAIYCIKRSDRAKQRDLRNKYYQKAITYCDCIQYFTNDYDKFICFDRIRESEEFHNFDEESFVGEMYPKDYDYDLA